MLKISLRLFWLSIALSSATAIRPWLGFTISDWVFILGLAFSFFNLAGILMSGVRRTRPLYYVGAILIVVAAVTSGWGLLRTEDIYLYTLKLAFTFLIYIPILSWSASDAKILERFRDAWIYSGAMAGLCAALQYQNGGNLLGNEAIYGRMTGLTEHPNELGVLAAVVLPQALQKVITERGRMKLISNLILAALIVVGLLLSVSMTGLICGVSAVVGSLAFSYWHKATRQRALWMSVILITLALPMGYLMQSTLEDFADRIQFTRGGEKQTTLDTRIMGVKEIVVEGGGITVLGKGVYAVVDADGNAVHNMFLRAGVELGLFGLLGLLVIVGVILWVAIQKVKAATGTEFEFKAGLLVSYLILLLGGQVSPVLMQRNLWLPALFILAPDLPKKIDYAQHRVGPNRHPRRTRVIGPQRF